MTSIEEVKSRLDIIDIINGYVPLKQAGTNWRACCPFHQEKTPSFMVSKEKQIWHCFGCNEGGDVISFVKKYEGLEFPEALKLLADKAGIILPEYKTKTADYKKNVLWEIATEASHFWTKQLHVTTSDGEATRHYLKSRGIEDQTIAFWGLGLAGEGWHDVYTFLKGKGYSDEDIFAAGLTIKKETKYFDRFRQRLMIPLRDFQGKIVGFTARTLMGHVYKGEEFGGKYVNTPQTAIYNKSVVLYGLDFAKQAIKQSDYVIVVEGNLDVIMSHQCGVKNVVAVSGTALTADQIRMIKRFTDNVILAFDSDAAGSQALFKSGIITAGQFDMNVKVIVLDGAKDAADLCRENPDQWKEAIRNSIPIVDFYFEEIVRRVDMSRSDHKKIAVRKLLEILAQIADSVEQDHYIKKLAKRLDLSEDMLRQQMQRPQSLPQETTAPKESKVYASGDTAAKALMALVLTYSSVVPRLVDHVEPEMLPEPFRGLYKKIIIHYTRNHSTDLIGLTGILESQEATTYSELVHIAEELYPQWDTAQYDAEFETLITRLKRRHLKAHLKELSQHISIAEATGDQTSVERLTREFSDVSKKISQYLK